MLQRCTIAIAPALGNGSLSGPVDIELLNGSIHSDALKASFLIERAKVQFIYLY